MCGHTWTWECVQHQPRLGQQRIAILPAADRIPSTQAHRRQISRAYLADGRVVVVLLSSKAHLGEGSGRSMGLG